MNNFNGGKIILQYKKLSILIIVLISLLFIGTVSAANNSTADIGNSNDFNLSINDENSFDDVQKQNIEISTPKTIKNSDSEKLLGNNITVSGNTFKDISNAIENADDGDTIFLSGHTYKGSDRINIEKPITIIGQNDTVLDGQNVAKIFYVTSSNVYLKNITFINGNYHKYGGAIEFYGCFPFTLSNCTFINNKAQYGGAIECMESRGTISNCTFINNYAPKGGAIDVDNGELDQSECMITVSNCSFINNQGDKELYGYGNIINSKFIHDTIEMTVNDNTSSLILKLQNKLDYSNAFASSYSSNNNSFWNLTEFITLNGYPNIEITTLANQNIMIEIWTIEGDFVENITNQTDNNGSFIYDYSKLNDGFYKYKVSVLGDSLKASENGLIKNGNAGYTFKDLQEQINNAPEGSTLYLNQSYYYFKEIDKDITDGVIINKALTIIGNGAILDAEKFTKIFYINNEQVTIKNITFVNGYDGNGGAIYISDSKITISNCTFINNDASENGGAININYGNEITISNCTFTNITSQTGGAIYWSSWGSVIISNCAFTNITSQTGGAIYCNQVSGTVSYCNFTNCISDNGGAIYWNRANGGTVSYCNFINCTSNNYGGAVYWYRTNDGTISNCNFINNAAKNNNGGSIFWTYSNKGKVSDCTFINNTAKAGGAITWSGADGHISNCNFINNTAKTANGGAIYWANSANGNVSDCTFINNTGKSGGAISISGNEGYISNSIFINNIATTIGGGAIYWSNSNNSAVFNCNFTNNSAKEHGGAIVWSGINGTVSTCDFKNNSADYGGAISWYRSNGGNVSNCNFIENHANINGSAISWLDFYDGTIANSFFRNEINSILIAKDENSTLTLTLNGYLNYNNTINTKPVSLNNLTYWNNISVNSSNIDSIFAVPSANKNITLLIFDSNNKLVYNVTSLTNDFSQIKYDYSKLSSGNYTYKAFISGDSEFPYTETNGTFERKPHVTQLTAPEITTTYNSDNCLIITLKDDENKFISNAKISVDLNGIKEYVTDANGQVKVPTSGLTPNTYIAKISFKGNENYTASSIDAKVVINKATPKITAKAKTFKAKTKTKKYTITLKDNKGKPIKNVKVRLTVKKYKKSNKKTKSKKKSKSKKKKNIVKTNSKGKATFIVKNYKKGSYKGIIIYNGNSNYNKVTKKVKLTIK